MNNDKFAVLKEKQEAAEKIAARAFAQSYLSSLVPTIFDNLLSNGFFHDVVEKEVEAEFMPWLEDEVEKNLERARVARKIVDGRSFFSMRRYCHYSGTHPQHAISPQKNRTNAAYQGLPLEI